MNNELKRRVIDATVKLPALGGRGVVVPGHYVVTAAHCVNWDIRGGMVLGDHHIEVIEKAGDEVVTSPVAVEPVVDIAVLGAADEQELYDDWVAFEGLCGKVTSVPISLDERRDRSPFPIHIWTHKERWIHGVAQKYSSTTRDIFLEVDEPIEGGTSGSPVVDDTGALVGVVSNGTINGTMPWLCMALPRGLLESMSIE